MKAIIILTFILICFGFSPEKAAPSLEEYSYVPLRRKLMHAEEFYGLYRENFYRGTENLNANVYWLHYALKAPFAPPVQALAKIETPKQWDKYKKLFHMHMNFLIMENYLRLGERYEKNNIYFFNYAFAKEIKEGLEITKIYYKRAEVYWKKVAELSGICFELRDIELYDLDGEVAKWEDRVYKIHFNEVEVNYTKEIQKRLQEVEKKTKMIEKGEYKK